MYTIRKKFRFEAAHRLSSSYSKECQRIHGHSYTVEVFVKSEKLNGDGMVVDFGIVNSIVKPILDAWDHRLLIHEGETGPGAFVYTSFNPTAENMAHHLSRKIQEALPHLARGVKLTKVRVHETETGWAEYEEDA